MTAPAWIIGERRNRRAKVPTLVRRIGSIFFLSAALAVNGALPAAAQNQSAAARAIESKTATQVALAEKNLRFDIPSQPLASAFDAFIRSTGWQVGYAAEIAQGVKSPGVSGAYTPEEALRGLLLGTGLTFRFTGANTVILEKSPGPTTSAAQPPKQFSAQEPQASQQEPAIALPQVTVQDTRDRGFVATQSSVGTKTDTPLIETPQSISVVTRAEMDAQGIQSVAQALRYTPGIAADYYGPSSMARDGFPRGRGFFLDQYLDGLKLAHVSVSNSYSWIEPYELERIEILKGPSSVLYGQASPGGVVNFVSKRPIPELLREVNLTGGSFDRIQGGFDLAGPIDKDGKLLYRLIGLGRHASTQVEHTKDQRLAVAPALTWRPSSDTTLTVLAKFQHDPNLLPFQFMPAQGTVLPNPNGSISSKTFTGEPSFDNSWLTQYQIGYLAEHHINSTWTIRQNFRYIRSDERNKYVFAGGLNPLDVSRRTVNRLAFLYDADFDMYAIDNQAQSKFDTGPFKHTFLLGLDYRHSAELFSRGFGVAPSLDIFNPVYGQNITAPPISTKSNQVQDQIGLYAQDQIRVGNWAFLFSGRHDWAGGDTETRNTLINTTVKTRQADRAFTWRAGLVYLFAIGVAPYFSYAESFQPTSGTDFNDNPFEPTTGQQYEVGVKYQPTGSNSFITLSAFHLKQQNVLTTDPAHTTFSIQTGEVRSRGIELEGKANVLPGLDLTAGYSYVENVVTKSNGADRGKIPTRTPKHMASLWGEYTFQSGTLTGLGLGAGVRYLSATFGDPTNTFKVSGYTLADAALRYELAGLAPVLGLDQEVLRGWRIAVNTSNLSDKEYVGSCTGITACYFGSRRTILSTLSYRW